MIEADLRQIEKFTKELGPFAKRAVPFARMLMLNNAAFDARQNAIDIIEKKFVLRTKNKFTRKSIQFEKATKLHPEAVIGSRVEYMADQEFGATKVKKGKEGVPIPTSFSSGEGLHARPRRKLPQPGNALRTIQLSKRKTPGKTNKQKLLLKVRYAVETGDRYLFHDFGGRKKKGIFKVTGGEEGSKRGWPEGANLRMVYDLSKVSVRIPKRPWLVPAVEQTQPKMPAMFIKALEKQVKRQRLFLASKR